jgi:hypothetical protein
MKKVKYFNQCFLSLLEQIPQDSKPTEDITIEFYTSVLPISMEMFVKTENKYTLEATFQEALKIKKNMLSLKGNPGVESSKNKNKNNTKAIVTKYLEETKDIDSMDMKSLQIIVKKLSNELIYLKKHNGEGSSTTMKLFKFQYNKDKSTPPINNMNPYSSKGINMEDIFQALQHWATEI